MTRTNLLIVGAGPTGLGAAWHLTAKGETNWLLSEAMTPPSIASTVPPAGTPLEAQGECVIPQTSGQ